MSKKLTVFHRYCVAVFLGFIYFSGFSAPMSGMYTIGGTSPDYSTFNAAVSALTSNGISGNVLFEIRPGTYTEQVKIGVINGSGSNAVITFQSSSGKPEDVIVTHEHTSSSTTFNYTLYLDGTDFVQFKGITFQAEKKQGVSADYNRVVYITSNSNNILFENNIFQSWYVAGGSSKANPCIFIGSDLNTSYDNDSITFNQNTIYGGNDGIYLQGDQSAGTYQVEGTRITNNVFRAQSKYSLNLVNIRNSEITGNYFDAYSDLPTYAALVVSQHSDSLLISGNKIIGKKMQFGLSLNWIVPGSSGSRIVSNNSLSVGPDAWSNTLYGIYSSNNRDLQIVFNSVNINAPSASNYAFYSYSNDTLNLYNNQFVNQGPGGAYYISSTSANSITSDHNNLYSMGTTVASVAGNNYSTLADLVNATSNDNNSVSVDPHFMNDHNLIPYNDTVFDQGKTIPGVTVDFFGNNRNSTPDIGIYEGNPPAIDAAISGSSSEPYACPNSSYSIYADLTNFGKDTLTSATIGFMVNDSVYPSKNWSGNLAKFQSDKDILLGTIYPTGPINVKIWVTSPNGKTDQLQLNDTLFLEKNLAFNGTYTVGASEDFETLQDAIDAMAKTGLCGAVTLNVKSGVYTGQTIIPQLTGLSDSNTLTVRSATGNYSDVTFEYSSTNTTNNYILRIEKADYIRLKNLSFNAKGSSYSTAIHLEGGSYNVIDSNYITGNTLSAAITGYYRSLVRVNGYRLNNSNHNIISNNIFFKGGTQVALSGTWDYPDTGNMILNNSFDGPAGRSIYSTGQNNHIVQKNSITGTRNSIPGAFHIYRCTNGMDFSMNKIAINRSSSQAVKLEQSTSTDTTPYLLYNNFIASFGNSYASCMDLSLISNVKIYHNNMNAVSSSSRVMIMNNSLTNIELYNNIFSISGDGQLYYSYYSLDTANIASDYNVFYGTGSAPFGFNNLGSQYTYDQYRMAFLLDSNSIFTAPNYVNDTNLHIDNGVLFNGKGLASDIVTDIDGDSRGNPPDIGADEFDLDPSTLADIELLSLVSPDTNGCLNKDSIIIQVVNHSLFTIDSFNVEMHLFGMSQFVRTLHDTIASGDTIQLNLGEFLFVPGTHYVLDIEVSLPNGMLDNANDDNAVHALYWHMNVPTIFQEADECTGKTELYIKNFPYKKVEWSTGSQEIRTWVSSAGTYSVTVEDEHGCKLNQSIKIN